jgi:transcriptional regulator with XRE-family HTH domain
MVTIPRPCKLLKDLRLRLDLSQETLAADSGVSRRMIQEIEKGTLPNVATLEALAGAMGREGWEFLLPEGRTAPTPIEDGALYTDAVSLLIAFLDAKPDTKTQLLQTLGLREKKDPRELIDRFRKSLKTTPKRKLNKQ